jgi:hypothetical protein
VWGSGTYPAESPSHPAPQVQQAEVKARWRFDDDGI